MRPEFKSSLVGRGAGRGSKEAEDGGTVLFKEASRGGEARWTGKVSLGVCRCLLVMAKPKVFTHRRWFLSQSCVMFVFTAKIYYTLS